MKFKDVLGAIERSEKNTCVDALSTSDVDMDKFPILERYWLRSPAALRQGAYVIQVLRAGARAAPDPELYTDCFLALDLFVQSYSAAVK